GLAVELGQRGVSCVLVERHLQPQPIPKGQNLTNRTLEHFYFWHCVDELRAARVMPPGYPIGGITVYHDLTSPYFHAQQSFGGRDGGRSLVRQSMGIDRGGRNFDQRMVLAVFRSRELHEFLNRFPPSTTYRVMKPQLKGYWQFFGRIDVGESFFFHAPVPPDASPDNFDFLGLLHDAAGFPFHAEF